MRFAADEAVEVLEAAASCQPRRTGPSGSSPTPAPRGTCRTAPSRSRSAQRLRQRRARVRPDRVVAGSRRRHLRDRAHADRVMIAARQERLPGGRAERRRVKAVEPEPTRGKTLCSRVAHRPPEGTRRAETGVVEQDDQDVGSSGGRPKRLDRRELRLRVIRILVYRPPRTADPESEGDRERAPRASQLLASGTTLTPILFSAPKSVRLVDLSPPVATGCLLRALGGRRRGQSSVMMTLPLAWPCSTYASASRVWSNGNVLPMNGRRWPAS